MARNLILAAIVLMLTAACTGQGGTVNLQTFLGGNDGIVVGFEKNAPPDEVFDGGDFPFDIVVKLENKGEFFVPKDLVTVTIAGVRPQEFNMREEDLKMHPDEDLVERKSDSTGKVIEPSPVFVEFKNLNHDDFITGNSLKYPFRAEACYLYGTTASTKLCVRKNLADPEENGLCEIDENKPVSTSGAPVQISDVQEFKRGKDSVGFSFSIKNTASTTGKTFAKGSGCEGGRSAEDRVFVQVESKVLGITCQGLNSAKEGLVEGTITLYNDERTITCTQQVPSQADYELPITINLAYDYRDNVETTVIVKHSSD